VPGDPNTQCRCLDVGSQTARHVDLDWPGISQLSHGGVTQDQSQIGDISSAVRALRVCWPKVEVGTSDQSVNGMLVQDVPEVLAADVAGGRHLLAETCGPTAVNGPDELACGRLTAGTQPVVLLGAPAAHSVPS
jgi:hypothetical protein